jgi:PIN domain nuclease of toxin-antitoxin system
MTQYVTDTMAIVSYLGKRRLPPSVKQVFQSADLGLSQIVIPAIVAFEIGYLAEKGRIDVMLADLRQHLIHYPSYHEQALTLDIIETAFQISDIPELHDRLIAGTARHLGKQLITNDPLILASAFVGTFWV